MVWLNWSDKQQAWVLRKFEDGWRYVGEWTNDYQGEDEDGETIDLVDDSVLVTLAEYQSDGYEVKVTINAQFTQTKGGQ